MTRRGAFLVAAWAAITTAVSVPGPGGAAAAAERPGRQEADPDTLPGGRARPDTLPEQVPGQEAGDTLSSGADTTARLREFPSAPPQDSAFAVGRFTCDRECLLDHSGLVLMDLVERELPGFTAVRASYFGGPHHFRSGALGPGFTELRLDERPLPALAGGQPDLSRIPLASLDRVTVTEGPGGIVVDASPLRRREPRAYSRISAGTGSPDVNMIRALYANGLGGSFSVSTGIDLLNARGQAGGGDRFDFWGTLAWLPGEEEGGVELQWRNQSLDRRGLDTATVDRTQLHVVGRGRLREDLWITVSAGSSRREVSGGEGAAGTAPGTHGTVEADGASVAFRAGTGARFLEGRVEAMDGPAQPRLRGRLAASLRPLTRLGVSGAVGGGRWDRFDSWSVEVGASYRAGLGVDLELGAGAAAGLRGIPRPLAGRADSVTFRQGQARASASWGPVTGGVRGYLQRLSRVLPFGGTLDPELAPGPSVTVGAVEGMLELPLLPMDWLLGEGAEPVRLAASWRHQELLERGGSPPPAEDAGTAAPADLYLPAEQGRVAARFRDDFFQGDLQVTAELAARHRGPMTTVDPAGGVGEVRGWTTLDWNLVLKLKDARIWWRVDNTRSAPWSDVVGVIRPLRRNVFGVKWEFFN